MNIMVNNVEKPKPQDVPIIALLTDFGIQDSYVGVMKAVIWSICPTAQILDLTHHIPPQNVKRAAYVLMTALDYLPPQTIVVVVVDPGVGSTRRPVAVKLRHCTLIAPDNGVLSYVTHQHPVQKIVQLQQYILQDVSNTFHGRDIFSPAAAHLARGVSFDELGPPVERLEQLPMPSLQIHADYIEGEVIDIDRFGNVITSIGRLTWNTDDLLVLEPRFLPPPVQKMRIQPERCKVMIGEHTFNLSVTYSGVSIGQPLALINSAGQLEVAVNNGNAAATFGFAVGDAVILKLNES
ncbi:MAG: hypothetical protein CUN55_05500 [Phototrophicales bacterium]|nr:MAG: hypothetical protein CUN55_05500 [Phototrophicales bacterium]